MRCELTKNYRHQIRIINCFILSALDRWFQSRSGQTKDHTIANCCILAKHS